MKKEILTHFLLLTASAAAVFGIIFVTFRYFLRWLLPFLLALAISASLEPFILWCRRRLHLQRGFSAAVATIACVILLGLGLFRLFSAIVQQATALLTQLPLLLSEIPPLLQHWQLRLLDFCAACPEPLRGWSASLSSRLSSGGLQLLGDWSAALLAKLPSLVSFLPELALTFATTVLAVFYTSSRFPDIRAFLLRQLPPRYRSDARQVKRNVCLTVAKWLRAETLLWLLTFGVLLAGLLLLRVEFALLLSFLISFVDLLPVLGTGTVLLPWAAVSFLLGRGTFSIGLLALQLVLLLQRSLLEPKLLAAQANLPPLAALLAMYLGFCSVGIAGMLLFPLLLLLIKQLHDAGCIRIWK